MDDQQQQRINRAAQEFTDALVAAYRTASDNTAVAQQLSARQIEYFFDAVMGNLRAQAGGTSQMARQLAGQQRLAQETTRALARVSTDNYMDLLDSVFSFYQGGASRTQRRADEARGHIEQAEARASRPRHGPGRPRPGPRRPSGPGARPRAGPRRQEDPSVAKRRATEAEKRPGKPRPGRADPGTISGNGEETPKAQRRALEAEGRAEEAERSRSEAESRGGDEEGDTEADAASQPQSQWVRTSGRSKVRGRNTRARNRSSGRRR